MNHLHRQKYFFVITRSLLVLLATLILSPNAFAQTNPPQRWLFAFDLSSAMKKRLPATEAELKIFFAGSGEGQLHAGDQIGVWTYDQKLQTGEFPLTIWNPAQAVVLTSNLVRFLRAQKYAGDSQIAVWQPTLSGVIANSERLTTLIFCDGQSEISSTAYDDIINQDFRERRTERAKIRQPFVVLLRTQLGKYVGCTVNFPPATIDLPQFPPLPTPPPKTNSPPPIVVPPKPAPVVPDLIVVGKRVGTNIVVVVNPTTNFYAPETNEVSVVTPKNIVAPITNPIPLETAVRTNINLPATNSVAASANENPGQPMRWPIYIGIGLMVVVVVVGFLIFRSSRKPGTSLITSSMQDDPRRK